MDGTLEIRNMDEADLAAFFFLNYPSYLTSDECREHLEYEILQIWDIDCDAENASEEDRSELPAISPYWLYRVLAKRAHDEIDSLPLEDRLAYMEKSIAAIWDYRAKNWDAIVKGELPSLPPPLPLPQPRRGTVSSKPRRPTPKNKGKTNHEYT